MTAVNQNEIMLSWIRSRDIDIFREEMITNLKKVMLKILAQPKEKAGLVRAKASIRKVHTDYSGSVRKEEKVDNSTLERSKSRETVRLSCSRLWVACHPSPTIRVRTDSKILETYFTA